MRTGFGFSAWGSLALVTALVLEPSLPSPAAPQVYTGADSSASFLVDGAGSLLAWGENSSGQLGIGGHPNQTLPVTVTYPAGVHGWRAIVPASNFSQGGYTYAIGDDGQLYEAGFTGFYTPANFYFARVTPVVGINGWTSLSASGVGWLAVATNGYIYGNVGGTVTWAPRPGAVRWTQVALGDSYQPN